MVATVRRVAVAASLVLALGCSKPAEPPPPASPAPAAPAEAAPPPAVEELAALREPWTGDLDAMAKRRVVRVLVTSSRSNYFIDQGRPRGLTAEALGEFEKQLNSKLRTKPETTVHVVAIPVRRDQILPALAEGRGDLAAANLTITAERRALVDFAAPLATGVRELVVTAPGSPPLASAADLSGREVFVRASSSYHASLGRLNERFAAEGRAPIEIRAADEVLEDEDLLEMVAAGLLPATVVDDHVAGLWRQVFPALQVHESIAVAEGGEIAWAVRKGCPQLGAAASEFARANGRGTLFGNVLLKRYLQSAAYVKNASSEAEMKRFREMVDYFRRYADQYEFDWLLVAAQGYQESGLDQSKRSAAGAVGVMQLLPTTAADKSVGIPDISTADRNIEAGVKYLRFLVDHYFDDPAISKVDRHLMAFASYNAGPNRIARLRKEAAALGLDPNRWFQNVEVVAARDIGRETVTYVSNIYKYYVAYRRVVELSAQKRQAGAATTGG